MPSSMQKIEAIIRPERLQDVQDALDELGVSGLNVTEVMGCGRQKGYTEQYRGSRANISLLPNLKAPDLAGIRRVVCRHLVSAGYVRDPEEVKVGVVRPRDLRLVEPAAVFRSRTDPDLWLPAVEGISADGPVVGVLGRPAQL